MLVVLQRGSTRVKIGNHNTISTTRAKLTRNYLIKNNFLHNGSNSCTFWALMASFVMEAILALETGSLLFTIAFSCILIRTIITRHMSVVLDSKYIFRLKLCLNWSTYLTAKVGHCLHDFEKANRQLGRRKYHLPLYKRRKSLVCSNWKT